MPAVDGLALTVVEGLNPPEAALFDAASAAFWAEGGRLPATGATGGLDIDIGPEFAAALAPAALAVGGFALKALADAIAQLLTESAKLAARDAYGALLGRLGTGRGRQAGVGVALPAAMVGDLQARIAQEARRHLSPQRADDLAKAVVAQIATPSPGG